MASTTHFRAFTDLWFSCTFIQIFYPPGLDRIPAIMKRNEKNETYKKYGHNNPHVIKLQSLVLKPFLLWVNWWTKQHCDPHAQHKPRGHLGACLWRVHWRPSFWSWTPCTTYPMTRINWLLSLGASLFQKYQVWRP